MMKYDLQCIANMYMVQEVVQINKGYQELLEGSCMNFLLFLFEY